MKHRILIIFFLFAAVMIPACDDDSGGVQPDAHEGIVRDYTDLDGCCYIIEMLSGEKLEPVEMADTTFRFYDGQRVEVWYTELTNVNTLCMAGKTVRIDSIRELGCNAMTDWSNNLSSDPFLTDSVGIDGNCLVVDVNYGGGCEPHNFFLSLLPTMGPLPVVTISHNAHGDLCEAWIHERRSFDLSPLQSPGSHSVTFVLTINVKDSSFRKEITYRY